MDLNIFVQQNIWWLLLIFVWATAWKAWALWIAAKKDQKMWFLVFIILSTAGILEMFYIFYFSSHTRVSSESKK